MRLAIGRPVIFRQKRPGLRGVPFTLYRFRTMNDACGPRGELLPDSQRLTPLGRFLRKTSLDELPELINVLKGNMSLVGPRPLLERYYPYFIGEERARFLVRPGVTGLSQVQGRNDLSWDLRIAKDVEYVQRYSLLLDLRILLLTLLRVLRQGGVRVDPGATMLDFDEERRRHGRVARGADAMIVGGAQSGFTARNVVPAVPGDEGEIYRLIVSAFVDSYLKFTIYQSSKTVGSVRDQITDGIRAGAPRFFVMRCGAALAGFYSAVRRGGELFLSYVATDPRKRSRGAGRALIDHFEATAGSIGCASVGLDVFASNAVARAWYARHGYAVKGTRYHLRFSAATLGDKTAGALVMAEGDLREALAAEAARGFSSVDAYFRGDPVRLGLIDGVVCNILDPRGPSAMPVACASVRALPGTRKWVLVTSMQPLPEQSSAESVEEALYMTKPLCCADGSATR